MAVSVEDVMRECHNFFDAAYYDGEFAIKGGMLDLPEALPEGTFIAITGSACHNGVFRIGDDLDVPDEAFAGRVYMLHPPKAFLALCQEIAAYDQNNPAGALQSESFGEYAYTRSSGQNGQQGWQSVFFARLTPYRRMFTEVDC